MMANDPFDLNRFVAAQDAPWAGSSGKTVYDTALAELHAGDKQEHWMWFVLPQLRSLGQSATAKKYGIAGMDEARAYWDHPVLGPRLRECVEATMTSGKTDPVLILGDIDAKKYRSCLTLFLQVAPGDPALTRALARFYGGKPCRKTLAHIGLPEE